MLINFFVIFQKYREYRYYHVNADTH